jgi:hypothetical protein
MRADLCVHWSIVYGSAAAVTVGLEVLLPHLGGVDVEQVELTVGRVRL